MRSASFIACRSIQTERKGRRTDMSVQKATIVRSAGIDPTCCTRLAVAYGHDGQFLLVSDLSGCEQVLVSLKVVDDVGNEPRS